MNWLEAENEMKRLSEVQEATNKEIAEVLGKIRKFDSKFEWKWKAVSLCICIGLYSQCFLFFFRFV